MKRNADVSGEVFLAGLVKQGENGLSNTEIAAELGMEVGSFQTRKSVTIKKFNESAKKLGREPWPYLVKKGRRPSVASSSMVDTFSAIRAKLRGEVAPVESALPSPPVVEDVITDTVTVEVHHRHVAENVEVTVPVESAPEVTTETNLVEAPAKKGGKKR